MDALLQREMLPSGSDTLESLWLPTSSSSVLQGAKSMFCHENGDGDASFPPPSDKEESVGEEQSDDSCSRPVKKRRLSSRQVESLERFFAVENKLEPERKLKLAKELGMQPRQVAIWFQNRRARFKNKQLEKDYDLLKASCDKLKADCDSLRKENETLRTEVAALKQKLPGAKGKVKGRLELDLFNVLNSSNANFDALNVKSSRVEEVSSVKSDVVESDSANGTDFCYAIVPDQADFCKDEVGNLNKRLLQPPMFPSFQLECFYDHPLASFGGFGFTGEDQTLWSSLC